MKSTILSIIVLFTILFTIPLISAQIDTDNDANACINGGFSWGFGLESGNQCCGDDVNDEGMIKKEATSNIYHLCNKENNYFKWVPSSQLNKGYIAKISNFDKYDAVSDGNGNWFACDSDNSLPANYRQSSFQQNCGATEKCATISSNQFICNSRQFETIGECKFSNELKIGDEKIAYDLGFSNPSPFTQTLVEFNRQANCQNNECIIDFSSGQNFETISPQIRIWAPYSTLTFEIYFEHLEDYDKLKLKLQSTTEQNTSLIKNHFVSSKTEADGVWYRYMNRIVSGEISLVSFQPIGNMGNIRIRNIHLQIQGGSIFCTKDAIQSYWKSDLDKDETACNAQKTTSYTGNHCCGDDLITNRVDPSKPNGEFYSDENNCYNSKIITSTQEIGVSSSTNLSNIKNKVLSAGNNYYSCNPVSDFFWMKQMRKTTDTATYGSALFVEKNQCESVEFNGTSFYCNDEWESDTYETASEIVTPEERTQVSYDQPRISSGCCKPNDCWDGNTCVENGQGTISAPAFPGEQAQTIVCNNGNWIQTTLKYDWMLDESGSCSNQNSCFLDDNSRNPMETETQDASRCKPNNWYSKVAFIPEIEKTYVNDIDDIYCDSGMWTSRTNFVAKKLLQIRDDEFTLVCDRHFKVLENNSFIDEFTLDTNFRNSIEQGIFNNLCILSYDDEIVVGSSFNELGKSSFETDSPSIQQSIAQAFDITTIDFSSCSNSQDEYDFKRCTTNNGYFYWNDKTESFIYSPTSDVLRSGLLFRIVDSLYSIFIQPILALFGIQTEGFRTPPEPLRYTSQFKSIYLSESDDKKIYAVSEYKKSRARKVNEYFEATFENIPSDVCESVNVYDNSTHSFGRETIMCEVTGNKQTIFTILDSSIPSNPSVTNYAFVKSLIHKTRLR